LTTIPRHARMRPAIRALYLRRPKCQAQATIHASARIPAAGMGIAGHASSITASPARRQAAARTARRRKARKSKPDGPISRGFFGLPARAETAQRRSARLRKSEKPGGAGSEIPAPPGPTALAFFDRENGFFLPSFEQTLLPPCGLTARSQTAGPIAENSLVADGFSRFPRARGSRGMTDSDAAFPRSHCGFRGKRRRPARAFSSVYSGPPLRYNYGARGDMRGRPGSRRREG